MQSRNTNVNSAKAKQTRVLPHRFLLHNIKERETGYFPSPKYGCHISYIEEYVIDMCRFLAAYDIFSKGICEWQEIAVEF